MADTVSTLRAVYEADSAGFDRALDSIQGGIGKTVGALAGLAGAIGVSFAAGDTIQRALEFDKAMSNIRSVTEATKEENDALGESLKQTAMNSAIPGGLEAISGSYYEIVGGVSDAAAQQEVFNAAIATAEAGQANLGAVTSGLITAVNAYGPANLEAATASDVLSRTVKLGTKTMDEYVSAIGPIAGVMASVGVEFEDVGSMMAFMTTKGMSASQAATRMQAATVSLINPNKEMIELFKKAGITSGTAAIEQYGLAGTLDKLKEAAGGSTEGMTKALGSVEALGAAVALTGPDFADFTKTFADGVDGATEAARKLQLESVSAQFQIFQNTLSGIGLSIGQAFLPAINTLLSGFNAFSQDVQKLGLGGAIEKWWNAGIDWLQTNGPAILQTALQTALDIGQDIVTFVQTYGPNIVGGVIGLWEGVKQWFIDTGAGMFEEALKAGIKIAQDIGTFIINNGPDIVRGIETWAGDAWTWLRNQFGGMLTESLKQGLNLIGDLTATIAGAAPDIGLAIGNWIRSGLTWLTTEAPRLISEAISGLFSQPIDTTGMQGGDIAADMIPEPTVFEQLAQGAVDAMYNVFNTGIGLISGLFEGLFGMDKGAIKGFFDNFLGTEGPLNKFKTGIETIWNGIFGEKGALNSVVNTLKGLIGTAFETMKTTVIDILKPLLEPLATLMKAISLVFHALGDADNAAAAANAALAIEGMRAKGGQVMAGGDYLVGENGPEILSMGNRSGEVISGSRSMQMLNGGSGGGGSLSLHGVNIYGVENPEMFLDKLMVEAENRGLRLTY